MNQPTTPKRVPFHGSLLAQRIGLLILGAFVAMNMAIITYAMSSELDSTKRIVLFALLWLIGLVALGLLAHAWRWTAPAARRPDMNSAQSGRLGIPKARRVAGVLIVLLMYLVPIVELAYSWRHPTGSHVAAFSWTELRALEILAGAVWGTPFILVPCVLDRFPRFVTSMASAEWLHRWARGTFGVTMPE